MIHYYDSENEDPYDRYVNGVDYFALDHDEGQFDGYLKRYGTFAGTGITSFRMPSNLKYIAPETFRNCEQLKTFYIGKAFRGKINYGEEGDPDTLFLYYAPIRLIRRIRHISCKTKFYIRGMVTFFAKHSKMTMQILN